MKRFAAFTLLALSSPALAEMTPYQVDSERSSVEFSAIVNGGQSKGRFTGISGEIIFDPQQLGQSKADITVDLTQIESSYDEVAESLMEKDWFSTAEFPTAHFVSSTFRRQEDGSYLAEGKLTLRDVTQPATLQFNVSELNETLAKAEGSTSLSRLAFEVGQGEWKDTSAVSDDISITFNVTATR